MGKSNHYPNIEIGSQPGELESDELSAADKNQLDLNEGRLLNPVIVHKFDDMEEFRARSNNFFMFFANIPKDHFLYRIYKRRNVYKRFRYLYEDLFAQLDENMGVSTSEESNDQLVTLAYQAYQLMSNLVDENDENALTKDGQANEWTLVQ